MDKNTLLAIIAEAKQAAAAAAQAYVDNWTATTGGNRYGEPISCGFAWCYFTHYAGKNIDGRTKVGRLLREAGLVQAWPGYFQWWNPAGWGGQSEQVKAAGAEAAARVLEAHGFTISAGSKPD
jgi:hypothetical protein